MRKSRNRFAWLACLFLLLAGACNAAPVVVTSPPVLPTAQVPSLSEINDAYQRWQESGNQSYFAEVEERRQESHRKYLVAVSEGQVRAAQVLERQADGSWGEPAALPLEDAQSFTPEGIFDRLRQDAEGNGPGPVNLKVSYDPSLGYPIAIHAEAIQTYDQQGKVILDRRFNYDLTLTVKSLLEDTFGAGKQPVLIFQRSGGPEAFCDQLRVFSDYSTVYSDDCRENILQSQLPPKLQSEFDELQSAFGSLDSQQGKGNQSERLIVRGNGEGSADAAEEETAWKLANRFAEVLSEPVGLGLIVSYLQDSRLYGLDVYNRRVIPADLSAEIPIAGGVWSPDGKRMVISRDEGLTLYDNTSGEFGELLAPPDEGFYLPRGWSTSGRLLVDQIGDEGLIRHGWIQVDEKAWHDLPAPEGISDYGCDTGLALSPDGRQVAITGLEYGSPCNTNAGLTVADLENGTAHRIVTPNVLSGDETGSRLIAGAQTPSWSPDGEWIAFSLDQDASGPLVFPARLYRVHADGSALTPLTNNSAGIAAHPVWAPDGSLFYSLSGAGSEADGIYHYLPAQNTHKLLIQGTSHYPISISPDGEFLLYEDKEGLKLWEFRLEDVVAELPIQEEAKPSFVGWAQTGQ